MLVGASSEVHLRHRGGGVGCRQVALLQRRGWQLHCGHARVNTQVRARGGDDARAREAAAVVVVAVVVVESSGSREQVMSGACCCGGC